VNITMMPFPSRYLSAESYSSILLGPNIFKSRSFSDTQNSFSLFLSNTQNISAWLSLKNKHGNLIYVYVIKKRNDSQHEYLTG
jgi:hypothetical protein